MTPNIMQQPYAAQLTGLDYVFWLTIFALEAIILALTIRITWDTKRAALLMFRFLMIYTVGLEVVMFMLAHTIPFSRFWRMYWDGELLMRVVQACLAVLLAQGVIRCKITRHLWAFYAVFGLGFILSVFHGLPPRPTTAVMLTVANKADVTAILILLWALMFADDWPRYYRGLSWGLLTAVGSHAALTVIFTQVHVAAPYKWLHWLYPLASLVSLWLWFRTVTGRADIPMDFYEKGKAKGTWA